MFESIQPNPREVGIARIALRLDPRRRAAFGADHADPRCRIQRARLGIRNPGNDGIQRVGVVDQRKHADAGAVELPIDDRLAVGAEAETVANAELFLVDPVGGAVDGRLRSIGRQLRDAAVVDALDVDVVAAHVTDARRIRRKLREHQRRCRVRGPDLLERAALQGQHPVIPARVPPPHLLRIREDQQLRPVVRPHVVGDGERALRTCGCQLRIGDQDGAGAGGRVVADDVRAAGRSGGALDGRVGITVAEPSCRTESRQRVLVSKVDAIDLLLERAPAFVLLRLQRRAEHDERQSDGDKPGTMV